MQNYGSFISKCHKMIKIIEIKIICERTIWIILREVVGLSNDQKIVDNFIG